MAILEHWLAVLHGQASFKSPNFYWPQPYVLGFSDAVFLYAAPYVCLRSLGIDGYLSFEIVLIGLKILGFCGMAWFLRSFVKLSVPVVLIGASLFTLSNVYYIHIGHPQLTAVAFVPVLCCLGGGYWRECKVGRIGRGNRYLLGAVGLLGLLFFTSYYIAWFTVLALIGIAVTGSVGRLFFRRGIGPAGENVGIPKWQTAERLPGLVFAGLIFVAVLIPFFMTYLPAVETTGVRSYTDAVLYQWEAIDVINVGPSNWLWDGPLKPLVTRLRFRAGAGEKETGWTPLTLLLCIGGTLWALTQATCRPEQKSSQANGQWGMAALLGASAAILWLVSIQFKGHSLWWLVFHLVPGGAAIRVPSRIAHLLNVAVVIVISITIEKLATNIRKTIRWAVVGLFGIALVAEQVNLGPSHQLDRKQDTASLSVIPRPPADCKAFLEIVPVSADRPWFAQQVDAMLIARKYGTPTINGYSGWAPPEWNFPKPDDQYLGHATHWAQAKGIADRLCGGNFRAGTWSHIDVSAQTRYTPGMVIDFRSGGNSIEFEGEGWGGNEAGGAWTIGRRSVLLLNLPAVPQSELVLDLEAHAFTPAQRRVFRETLLVNGARLAEWRISDEESPIRRRVRIAPSVIETPLVRLEFINQDPRSPADFGLSTDARKIGLALHTIRLASD